MAIQERDVHLSNLVKVIEKVKKFKLRLEHEIRDSICADIYRTMNRVDVLTRQVESLRKQNESYRNKLSRVSNLIRLYNATFYLIFILGVALVIFVASYTILCVISLDASLTNAKAGGLVIFKTHSELLKNPVLLLSTLGLSATSILTISYTVSSAYRKVVKRVNYKELKVQKEELLKQIAFTDQRIKVLERRLRLDEEVKTKIHDIHRCLCHREYAEALSSLENLLTLINSLKTARDVDEKTRIVEEMHGVLNGIGVRRTICPYPVCEEYGFEITISNSVFEFLENIKRGFVEKKGDGLIKVRFAGSPLIYEIDLTKTILNYFSTS